MPDSGFSEMIGRRLVAVKVFDERGRVAFLFEDGSACGFLADGDCCSRSWIENVEAPLDVRGATVLSVDDSGVVDATEDDQLNPMESTESGYRVHECLKVYQTLVRTDRGTIAIEYRNSSNGYYGGYLTGCDLSSEEKKALFESVRDAIEEEPELCTAGEIESDEPRQLTQGNSKN